MSIREFVDNLKSKKKTLYQVKWKGQTNPTWEPSEIFNRTQDLRDMRKAFNDQII